MRKLFFYLVNFLTYYRLIAAPILIVLMACHQVFLFKWLLAISFFTDAVDGTLARTYRVTSKRGSVIDSIADDLTILAAIISMLIYKPNFILDHIYVIGVLLFFYLTQLIYALSRYGRMSSFHTYIAKFAAVAQGIFMVAFFFLDQPPLWLFYITVWATIADLLEEIVLVALLPQWTANVKGIYWVLKNKPAANKP